MKGAIVLLIFAAIVAAFFSDVLFGDRVLVTSNPARLKPWDSYALSGDLEARTYRTDALFTYLPRRVELTRSLRQGRIPLWNPYIFCGTPFLADPQSRVLYPVSLLLCLTDPARAMGYDVAIHFFIALLGMFLFLRALGASHPGSFAGAMLYGFSSFFFLRMGHPTFVASASYIPYFFYAYEKARVHEGRWTIALVGFLVLGYLSGFPQVFLLGALALAVYALHDFAGCVLEGRSREGLRALRAVIVSGVLSAAVLAVQLVPFAEFIRNSVGLGVEFEVMAEGFVWEPFFHIRSLVPGFFGNPVDGTSWLLILKPGHHQYNTGFMVYCGAGAIALLVAGFALVRTSRPVRGLVIILALAAGVASSAAILRVAYALVPLIAYSQIDRAAVIACFALAAIGGITFSEVLAGRYSRFRRYTIAAMTVLVLIVIAGGLVFTLTGERLIEKLDARAEAAGAEQWLRSGSLKVRDWVAGREDEWLAYERTQVMKSAVFLLLACVLIVLLVGPGRRSAGVRMAIGALFLICLAVDIFPAARSYYASQPSRLLTETDGIRFLKSVMPDHGRWRLASLTAPNWVLPVNTSQIFGLYHIDGRATVFPDAHSDLLAENTWAEEALADTGDSAAMDEVLRAHDMGCARYMLAPEVLTGVPEEQYKPVYEGDITVYENLRALDKGFCIPRGAVSVSSRQGNDILRVSGYMADPRRQACGSVSIVSYEPESVEARVTADMDCFMVFQDTYYPGWRARVDGEAARVHRTDLGFRAVEVPEGGHTVVMDFRPGSVSMGLLISIAGIGLSVIYGIKTKARRRA